MFSAFFLTCYMNAGFEACSVYYTEMDAAINNQKQCDQGTEMMHDYSINKVLEDHPYLTLSRKLNGCYHGSLSAGEVARDEHAKLLNEGLPAVIGEI